MFPAPQGGGAAKRRAGSGQSRPGLFWDCPRSCQKDGQSWEVPSLEAMGSTDIWGQRHRTGGWARGRVRTVQCQEELLLAMAPLLSPLPRHDCGQLCRPPPSPTVGAPLRAGALPTRLRWAGECVGPEGAVTQMCSHQSSHGRRASRLRVGRLGRAEFGVPRAARGRSSAHHSLCIPTSCRSGR